MCSWIRKYGIIKMLIIAKLICRLSEIPIKILALFLSVVIHKLILKFIWKCKVPRIVKLKLYNILSNFLINALQKNSMQALSDFLSVILASLITSYVISPFVSLYIKLKTKKQDSNIMAGKTKVRERMSEGVKERVSVWAWKRGWRRVIQIMWRSL